MSLMCDYDWCRNNYCVLHWIFLHSNSSSITHINFIVLLHSLNFHLSLSYILHPNFLWIFIHSGPFYSNFFSFQFLTFHSSSSFSQKYPLTHFYRLFDVLRLLEDDQASSCAVRWEFHIVHEVHTILVSS